MADEKVTIIWTDATGVYENSFLLESPTIADIKTLFTNTMMIMPGQEPKPETDAEFYARVSWQMVNQVAAQVQQNKQQQAMQLIPPIAITPIT